MEIMKNDASEPETSSAPDTTTEAKKKNPKREPSIFSESKISEESTVKVDDIPEEEVKKRDIIISPSDKAAFIDAIVSNDRFKKEYSLFGGKMKATLRSLTSDEVNALATWTAKQGTKDSAGLMSGRYRKYLLAAYLERLDGVEMAPLEEPLYETVGSDGKTVNPPAWVDRCKFFDGMGYGKFQALMSLVGEFDSLYSTLCEKAEDANFWSPDTP